MKEDTGKTLWGILFPTAEVGWATPLPTLFCCYTVGGQQAARPTCCGKTLCELCGEIFFYRSRTLENKT